MTAFEFMETTQKNEKAEENTNTPSLILNKFLISSSTVATPPPESIDFFKEFSNSGLRLTNLDQIIEDECFQEDPSLTPLIQTPPQSAASSINLSESLSINTRKDFLRLNLEFRKKHTDFKLNLQNSSKRFKRIKENYLKTNLENFSITDLSYEIERRKEDYESDQTEDEDDLNQDTLNQSDLYWESRRRRLGSEWERVQKKINLIKNKNLSLNLKQENDNINPKLINLKKELESLTDRYKPALKYFQNKVVKSNCVCELKLTENEVCIFCNLNLAKSKEESKNNNRNLDYINFDHSYTKLPNYSNPNNNNQSNDFDFLDSVDDDLLNKLVNERLNNLYNPSTRTENKSSSKSIKFNDGLPKFTNEDLMQIFDEQTSRETASENFIKRPKIDALSYNQSKLRQFRYNKNTNKINFGIKLDSKEHKKSNKRSIRSRSSSSTASSITEACIISSDYRYDLNNMFIPDEIISCHKINPLPNPKITTPTWRELPIEPLDGEIGPDEELDDATIMNRHKIIELKEKIGNLNKNVTESNKHDNLDLDAYLDGNSKSNLEWPERSFPLTDKEYNEMIENS